MCIRDSIYLLRKALKKADLGFVPVISLNLSGLDSQPGFKLSLSMLQKMLCALVYGDLLMLSLIHIYGHGSSPRPCPSSDMADP